MVPAAANSFRFCARSSLAARAALASRVCQQAGLVMKDVSQLRMSRHTMTLPPRLPLEEERKDADLTRDVSRNNDKESIFNTYKYTGGVMGPPLGVNEGD